MSPSTSQSVQFGATPQAQIKSSGVGFAGGGSLAFEEESSITDPYRWGDKKTIEGVIDLLVIREIRQIELDVVVADVSMSKFRDIGFDFAQNAGRMSAAVHNREPSFWLTSEPAITVSVQQMRSPLLVRNR